MDKIYLSKIDEYDRLIAIDSTQLKKGSFEFRYKMKPGEPVMIYALTGFDNGQVPVFVEHGTVNVEIKKAAFPAAAQVSGTPTNNLYHEYKQITERCIQEQMDSLNFFKKTKQNLDQWMNSKEGQAEWQRIGAASLVKCTEERIRFLMDHNDSPLAPLMMEKEIYYMLDNKYAEQMFQSLAPSLFHHPYYRSFSNTIRALDLKVGGELPDITLPLADGTETTLAKYRGKFVLLDFWASWCGPCRKEVPYMVQLYNETRDKKDQFAIISFSLDNKKKDWQDAIVKLGMNKDGWVHASDLLGWGSPAAQMMGVTAIPKTILIDPEGRAISFSLRGEEMVTRVKEILAGDRSYEGMDDGK